MHYIYATRNKAKLEHMRAILKNTDITFEELPDVPLTVSETGSSAMENAVIKAKTYFEYLKRPLFSCDTVLYIDNEPIVNVRKVNGIELDDEQSIAHYASLARSRGGKLHAQYRNAICIITKDNVITYDGNEIASKPFYIIPTPCKIRIPGFPLDSLAVDIDTGLYSLETQLYEEYYNFKDVFLGKLKNHNLI